ncbi:hypothetical protein GT347_00305 [Xylophilus rhododendri]|uniref:Hemolysin XhlA n=1 Tax=Xylophilus rhododendri TaxID=2697032 RepID=A0A857IZW3_9BURK|nr:hypothetical protein [Xylophilus rhododendri]QHI96573.1 hypothetical protein GT347_00305 [Xylophilus rhododendri]
MEPRIKKLEDLAEKTGERLATIEKDLSIVKATSATKEDLHREINTQTWKLVSFVCSFGTALVAATYYIAHRAS